MEMIWAMMAQRLWLDERVSWFLVWGVTCLVVWMGWDWGHNGRREEGHETWVEERVQDMSWLRQSTNNCLGCMGRTVATRSERGIDLRVLHQPVGPDDARGEDGAGRLGRAIA